MDGQQRISGNSVKIDPLEHCAGLRMQFAQAVLVLKGRVPRPSDPSESLVLLTILARLTNADIIPIAPMPLRFVVSGTIIPCSHSLLMDGQHRHSDISVKIDPLEHFAV